GAEQINTAIQQLDTVTQQNAGASEEMSATSEELAAQAEQLQETIAYFRTENTDAGNLRRNPAAVPRGAPSGASKRKKTVTAPTRSHKTFEATPVQVTPAKKNSRDRGFALDLANGGADTHDADFEHF
ncbi:MAG: methyl-accepting chemotaxis protein, partial [Alphaproteobacteria bacterium]|nr:methyl-accepting chemotaxis protein [Alphaproteobacteria bacterium]